VRTGTQTNGTLSGELDRITQQVDQYLANLADVSLQVRREISIEFKAKAQPLGFRRRRRHMSHVFECLYHIEGLLHQCAVSCFYLGQAQNIIDHAKQVLAAPVDNTDLLPLLRSQVLITGQKPGKAEDRVHRGPQFVGHVGQESTLGEGCSFSVIPGLSRLLLCQFPIVDLLCHAAVPDDKHQHDEQGRHDNNQTPFEDLGGVGTRFKWKLHVLALDRRMLIS